MIGAITSDGKLYVHIQDRAFNGTTIVQFLKHLLRHIKGKLMVIYDGLPAHRGQTDKDFLQQCTTQRIHLERRAMPLICIHRKVSGSIANMSK